MPNPILMRTIKFGVENFYSFSPHNTWLIFYEWPIVVDMADGSVPYAWLSTSRLQSTWFSLLWNFFDRTQTIFRNNIWTSFRLCVLRSIKHNWGGHWEHAGRAQPIFIPKTLCVCVCEKFVTKVQIPHHLQLLAFIAKCLFQFLVFACFFSRRWRDDIYGFVAIRKLINFYLLTVWHVCDVFVSCAVHIIPQSIQSIEVHWSGTSRWEKRPHGNGSTQVVWLCLGARCDITTSV